jgi:hypothetical protein
MNSPQGKAYVKVTILLDTLCKSIWLKWPELILCHRFKNYLMYHNNLTTMNNPQGKVYVKVTSF